MIYRSILTRLKVIFLLILSTSTSLQTSSAISRASNILEIFKLKKTQSTLTNPLPATDPSSSSLSSTKITSLRTQVKMMIMVHHNLVAFSIAPHRLSSNTTRSYSIPPSMKLAPTIHHSLLLEKETLRCSLTT